MSRSLRAQLAQLETETFEIDDIPDLSQAMPGGTTSCSTSTSSTTTSSCSTSSTCSCSCATGSTGSSSSS